MRHEMLVPARAIQSCCILQVGRQHAAGSRVDRKSVIRRPFRLLRTHFTDIDVVNADPKLCQVWEWAALAPLSRCTFAHLDHIPIGPAAPMPQRSERVVICLATSITEQITRNGSPAHSSIDRSWRRSS